MRRALLGGIAAFLLGTASAYLVPTSISRVPCRETIDLERLRCAPERSKALEVHIWADPDVMLPRGSLEAGIRLATEMMDEQGIPLYTRIVDTSLTAQYGPGTHLPDGVVGLDIFRNDRYKEALVRYGGYDKKKEELNPTAGYALLPERLALAVVNSIDVENSQMCPSLLPLRIATLLLHEIGHLQGLVHPDLLPESETMRTDIKMYLAADFPNVMNHNILGQTAQRWEKTCTEPDKLTTKQLEIAFDPVQGAQMRDAINGGKIWQTLEKNKFLYAAYVAEYECLLGERGIPIDPKKPVNCSLYGEEQSASKP